MLVGGRWAGWGRARAHTAAYARAYAFIGLLTVLFGPVVLFTYFIMIVVVPGAFCAHLLFVRLFPKCSWVRERRRAWTAAGVGVPLVVAGSLAWMAFGGNPPDVVGRFGPWGTAIYVLGIPVFLSNLGFLVGYLVPRGIPRNDPDAPLPPAVA